MIDPDVMDSNLPGPSGYLRPAANNTWDGTANRSLRDLVLSQPCVASTGSLSSLFHSPNTPNTCTCTSSTIVTNRVETSTHNGLRLLHLQRVTTKQIFELSNLRSVPGVLWLYCSTLHSLPSVSCQSADESSTCSPAHTRDRRIRGHTSC